MKTHKILLILFAAFSGWCGTMNAQDTDLKKRMKDADPKVIGTRIVNKFLVTPHTRFGNPRAEKAPNYVTYPDACTWLGALWFSKAVKNKDMQQRLKERFEPLFTTEKNMLPRMVGFGISNKQTFDAACANSSGAIIGSRFVTLLNEAEGDAEKAITQLKEGLKK